MPSPTVTLYPVALRCYLGRLWQADNPLGVPIEPVRLVVPGSDDARVLGVDLRGFLGTRAVATGWKLPVPARLFAPSGDMYENQEHWFPEPRPTWWPGERIVVEVDGDEPEYATVIVAKKRIGGGLTPLVPRLQ